MNKSGTWILATTLLAALVLGCTNGPQAGGQTGSELSCVTDTECQEALGDGHFCDETNHCSAEPTGLEPWTAREVCDRFLECADSQSPSQFGELFPVYGTNGSCFQDQGDGPCREACVAALSMMYYSVRGHPCNYCDTADRCPSVSSSRPGVCRPDTRDCVQCVTDADCVANGLANVGRIYCDRYQCNSCLVDEHCPEPECEQENFRCVQGSPNYCRDELPETCSS